ncbi:hypothetical protein ACFSJ3_18385 [Corallincola platygyrae]|uniref:DUF1585 domain-containing protein n=1 Tax=Corallincola platygyrae TaxID=1193278 RepID=A0ABW4XTX3_9GAMM
MTRLLVAALLIGGVTISGPLQAGSQEQAKRLHDRLAGVPPTPATLATMATAIDGGDAIGAAYTAMESEHFYNVTLKLFAAPWTNRDQSVFVPFNDYIATVIGMIRDDIDFRQVLQGDILYTGDGSLGLPAYSVSNNAHYEAMEAADVNLKTGLVQSTQSSVTGLPAEATAGVMTTRGAAKSFFIAGTNRAMFRFTLMNHMCRDLEQVHDTSRMPDRIRQDVTRSPGGDSRVFMNNCVGCHNGMDPLAQAFAYYNYEYDADADPTGENGRLIYNSSGQLDPDTGSRVVKKYRINANNFIYGYVTENDDWDNYWREGTNALLGWDNSLPGSGRGAKTMGQELAHSEAFAQCQVEKVFENVCLRPPVDGADRAQVTSMVNSFKASGYKMKQVFAESAVYCMGE